MYSRRIFSVLLRRANAIKCELMLSKCQINTNTNKNGFLLPTNCLEGVWKYSLSFNYFKFSIDVCGFLSEVCEFYNHIKLCMSISIPLLNILYEAEIHFQSYLCGPGILIALAHTLIALAYLNSIKKMHRLMYEEQEVLTYV